MKMKKILIGFIIACISTLSFSTIPGVTDFGALNAGDQPLNLLDTSFSAVQTYVDSHSGSGTSTAVSSISALRAVLHTAYQQVEATGYHAANDGGGGQYWYNATDTTSVDNGGTIIVASDGGRWYLQHPIDSIGIKQFGAAVDGSTDDTAAIQAAITWASSVGIRKVTVPVGAVYTTGTFTIPDGLTLSGVSTGPFDVFYNPASTIVAPTFLVTNTSASFITLAGEGAKVQDLMFYYPNQVSYSASTPIAYPFTLTMSGPYANEGIYRITIINGYQGIDIESGRIRISDVQLSDFYTDIKVDHSEDFVEISNAIMTVGWDIVAGKTWPQAIDAWVMNGGRAIASYRTDSLNVTNLSVFGRYVGHAALDSGDTTQNPTCGYGQFVNVDLDTVSYGVLAVAANAGANGFRYTNVNIGGNPAPTTGTSSQAAGIISTGGSQAPILTFVNAATRGNWAAGANAFLANTGTINTSEVFTDPPGTAGNNCVFTSSGVTCVNSAGGVNGPSTTVSGVVPTWNNTTGTLLGAGVPIGTSASNLLELNSSAKIPAVDGSLLTNVPVTVGNVVRGTCTSGYGLYNNSGVVGCAPLSGSGTVNTVSVATANGFAGTVANPTTTPVITVSTGVTGIIKGNGTTESAAVANSDYLPAASPTATGTLTVASGGTSSAEILTSMNATRTLSVTDTTSGAAILLTGNGSTTPTKTLAVRSGGFEIDNDALTSAILRLDDVGDLTVKGTLTTSTGSSAPGASLTTSGSTQTLNLSDTGIYGVEIQMNGNGSTTPSKFLATVGGVFQIQNNARSSAILSLDDSGDLSTKGTVTFPYLTTSGTISGSLCEDASGNVIYTAGANCYSGGSGAITATTITASGTITPSTTAGIVGTTLGNNAQGGSDGEYVSATYTGTSLTSGTISNAVSEILTAGDWDVQCTANFIPNTTTQMTQMYVGIGTTSATFSSLGTLTQILVPPVAGANNMISSPTVRILSSSSSTVFCVVNSAFTISTETVNGFIRARRVR
jgi:hypothetical protein